MNILEAIVGSLYPYEVDEALILKTCVDLGIAEDDEYVASDREKVAKAVIFILRNLITLASENNGGKSASYDVNKIKARIHAIAVFNGLDDIASEYDVRTRISDKTDLW